MNTISQFVYKAYTDAFDKAEAKVKEDVAHQRQDTELIVAALEKLTLKEQRPAMLVLLIHFGNRFNEDQLKEMAAFAFDMTSDDLRTLTDKVYAAMNTCSEPQPRKHPFQSVIDMLMGRGTKDDDEETVS